MLAEWAGSEVCGTHTTRRNWIASTPHIVAPGPKGKGSRSDGGHGFSFIVLLTLLRSCVMSKALAPFCLRKENEMHKLVKQQVFSFAYLVVFYVALAVIFSGLIYLLFPQ